MYVYMYVQVFFLPVIRMNVILQCCFGITGQSRKKLSHNVLVLYLLVSLELTEARVEVIQEIKQGS